MKRRYEVRKLLIANGIAPGDWTLPFAYFEP